MHNTNVEWLCSSGQIGDIDNQYISLWIYVMVTQETNLEEKKSWKVFRMCETGFLQSIPQGFVQDICHKNGKLITILLKEVIDFLTPWFW